MTTLARPPPGPHRFEDRFSPLCFLRPLSWSSRRSESAPIPKDVFMLATIPTTPSTFLSADQSAAELSTTPLAVRRLAARGALKAVYVGGDALRILPADMAAYASAGCPDLQMPPLSPNGGLAIDGPYLQAGRLKDDVEAFLAKLAEEEPEAPAVADIALPVTGILGTLISGPPYVSMSRISGAAAAPFSNRAEGYAVAYLRKAVGPAVEELYKTPAAYRAAVDATWQSWDGQSFAHRKNYPAPKMMTSSTSPTVVTWRVRFRDIKLDRKRVEALAF